MGGRVSSGTASTYSDLRLRLAMISAYRAFAIQGLLAESFLQALSLHLPVLLADPLNGVIDRRSPSAATHLLGGDC